MEKLKQTSEENYGGMSPEEYEALLAATEAMLAAEGMPAELESTQAGLEQAGYKTVGFEAEKAAVLDMQGAKDFRVNMENVYHSDPIIEKNGLKPCEEEKRLREYKYGVRPE